MTGFPLLEARCAIFSENMPIFSILAAPKSNFWRFWQIFAKYFGNVADFSDFERKMDASRTKTHGGSGCSAKFGSD
jgi:hypothetical protein